MNACLLPSDVHSHDWVQWSVSLLLPALQQRQPQGSSYAYSHNSPAGPDDLLVLELRACVPRQVSESIETMERERERYCRFDHEFRKQWQGAKASCQCGRLQMPSEHRADQVEESEGVETAAEDGSGDPVETGEDPRCLRTIDTQVGGYRSVETLFGKDGVGIVVGNGFSCSGSGSCSLTTDGKRVKVRSRAARSS